MIHLYASGEDGLPRPTNFSNESIHPGVMGIGLGYLLYIVNQKDLLEVGLLNILNHFLPRPKVIRASK